MLSTLITSKARRKVIKYFYEGGANFTPYVREIVRGTGLEINAVRRELLKLSKEKLLVEEARGNRLHYSLNPKHPIYFDLAAITAKEIGLGGELYKKRNKLGSVKFILMSLNFFLKNDIKSPIDLIIVGDIYLTEVKSIVEKYQKNLPNEVNYMVLSDSEYKLLKDRRDPMIVSILAQPRAIIYGSYQKFLNI